jgi:hypothetical protein
MNKELRRLAVKAGATKEMLKSQAFQDFCGRFADVILQEAENEMLMLAAEEYESSAVRH